ncbi:unnamed protein product [Gadus morhua 'NCC']
MQGGFHTHLLATLSLLLLTQVHAKVPCGNSSLTLPSWGAQSEYLAQCVLHSDSGPLCDWTTAQRVSGGVALTFLESPALSLEGEACLEFWYQMAPTASESLELRVLLKENTQGLLQIWTTPGQQNGGAWRHVSLPLAATKASTQVVFEADQESGVSFDHIGIRNGQCGRQCEPNTDLWTDKSTRCVCSAAEQLSCSTPLCPGGQTSDRPSESSAKGVMVGRGICTIHTDPQCSTFDGALFRFMAPCTYILAKTCVPIRGLPVFSVEVVNTQDAINASEATVERINVEVNNVRLSLLKRETKRVMVNGVWRSLPLTLLGATVKIRNNPAVVTVETDDRVLISYDNAGAVHLKLPSAYAGKVCGMCGNFNSLGEDDNRRPDGSAARDATDLALSWQTGAHAGPCDAVLVPHVCDPLEELLYGSRQFCGELLSTTGPFSRCLPVLGVESYYRSCVAGMCVSHGDLDAMCHTMQSYAKICYDAGVAVPAWRNGTTCTLECGANSHYEACADRCLDGCSSMDLAGTCGPCEERCVCDKGYKLSGGVCVLAENCGCWNDGRHYEKGAVFVHGGCTQRCQCLGNGQTLCSAWGCSGSQVCKDKDGVKGCFTPETVTCSMYGDPHYITYDGKAYDFQGGCNYTLATTCGEKTPVRFTVTGRNANPTDQNLTRSKLETVVLQIQELHLTLQQNRKVYVHNNQVRLPYTVDGSYGLLKVTRQRQFVVVETGVGLRVMIDGQNRLFLQVDERYKGQLCGMCGTYSDWQGDDFVRPDWSNATGAFDFGNSWRVMEDSSPCIALPDDPKVCDEQGDEQAVSDCSAILDDSFSACHKPVHPLKYVSSCVYDHCATSGDLHTLCDSLESYRAACQVAGVELPAWQNNTACAVIPNTTPPPTSTPLTPAPTPDQTLCALNCNFDSHVCGWQQLIQDSFDWTRQSGPTPSFSTGPNEDHTGEGYYMYIEGDGMTHGNSARLLSAQCNYRGPLCLQFWYHMHGSASAMALNIYHLHAVQAEKVWSMVNDQGSEWHQAFVDIKEKGTFQIIIEAIRGSTALSDVAIDDISIQFGSCSNGSPAMLSGSSLVPQTRREPLLSRPVCSLDCSFNGNLCGWSQAMTDAFDWTMERGSTPTLMTGPSADHTGDGHYLYIEANSATYGDTARLLSSECSLAGPQCLRFWYHMYGSADTMGLHVYLLQDRLAEAVWWKRNDQGDVWKEAMVELTATGTFQIIFEGRRGSNDQSDVAIDDVKLYHGLCSDLTAALPSSPQPNTSITTQGDSAPSTAAPLPPTGDVTAHTTVTVLPSVTSEVPAMTTTTTTAPLQETHPVCKMNCDFEQDLCEWNQMVTDVFDWTRHNGSSPTIRTGPSSDHMAGGGHYLYIEANSATYGDTARLLSSECSHTGPQCLRFWYHMYGSADTMGLHVYLLQDRLANSVWGKRNDQGDVWKEAMVDLTTDGPFRIIFEGRRGSNDQSDAAIDDVSLRPGHCAGHNLTLTLLCPHLKLQYHQNLQPQKDHNLQPQKEYQTQLQQDPNLKLPKEYHTQLQQDPNLQLPKEYHTQLQQDPNLKLPKENHTQLQQDPNLQLPKEYHTQLQQDPNLQLPKEYHTQLQQDPNLQLPKEYHTQLQQDPNLKLLKEYHIQLQQDPNLQLQKEHHTQLQQDPNLQLPKEYHAQLQQDPNLKLQKECHTQPQKEYHTQLQQDPNLKLQKEYHTQLQQDPNLKLQKEYHAQLQQDPNLKLPKEYHTQLQQDPNLQLPKEYHTQLQQDPNLKLQKKCHTQPQKEYHAQLQQDHNLKLQEYHTQLQQDPNLQLQKEYHTQLQQDHYLKLQKESHTQLQQDPNLQLPKEYHAQLQQDPNLKLQKECHTQLQQDPNLKLQKEYHAQLQQDHDLKLQKEYHTQLQQDPNLKLQKKCHTQPQKEYHAQLQQDHNLKLQEYHTQLQQDPNLKLQKEYHTQLQQDPNLKLQKEYHAQLQQDPNLKLPKEYHTQLQQDPNLQLPKEYHTQLQQDPNLKLQKKCHTQPQKEYHAQLQQDHNLKLQEYHTQLQQDPNLQLQKEYHTQLQQDHYLKLQKESHTQLQQDPNLQLPKEYHAQLQQDPNLKLQKECHTQLQQDPNLKLQKEYHAQLQQDHDLKLQKEYHTQLQQDPNLKLQKKCHTQPQKEYHAQLQQDHNLKLQEYHTQLQQDPNLKLPKEYHTQLQQDPNLQLPKEYHTQLQQDHNLQPQKEYHIQLQKEYHTQLQQDHNLQPQKEYHAQLQQDPNLKQPRLFP